MKKSKRTDEVEAGKDSKSKNRQVDQEPMRADLQEVRERGIPGALTSNAPRQWRGGGRQGSGRFVRI